MFGLAVRRFGTHDGDIRQWEQTENRRDRLDMLDELADVLQTLANLIVAYRVSDEELQGALDRCLERNQEKGRL